MSKVRIWKGGQARRLPGVRSDGEVVPPAAGIRSGAPFRSDPESPRPAHFLTTREQVIFLAMSHAYRRRCRQFGIALLAMLVLVQSLALPGHGLQHPLAAMANASQDAMSCQHGPMTGQPPMPCCEAAPALPVDCGSGACRCADGMLIAVNLPVPPPLPTATLMPVAGLAADIDAWLAKRHDAPPLRPPISA